MAANFEFYEDNGTQAGSPPKGTTRAVNRTEGNWKNIDDSTTAYSSSPITAGNNSFNKYQFGIFSGTFNQVTNIKWNHTSGTFGAGLTLKFLNTTGYTTPATATDARLTRDVTLTGAVSTGYAILVGGTGPEATGKQSSSTSVPCFTEYLVTQLQTTVAAGAGDTALCGLSLQYDENALGSALVPLGLAAGAIAASMGALMC
jgi:hypothetical protein